MLGDIIAMTLNIAKLLELLGRATVMSGAARRSGRRQKSARR